MSAKLFVPINNSELKFFEYVANTPELNLPAAEPVSLASVRKIFDSPKLIALCGEYADVSCKVKAIKARDGYLLPIRIFNDDLTQKAPVLILCPGTGYVLNTFEYCAIAFSRIAKFSGIKVVMPEHRLAPEDPLPVPIYDCYDVVKHVAMHSDEFNIDPDKIFMGGFSSGAHAVAIISNWVCDNREFKIHHQILYTGVYDATLSNRQYDDYADQDKWTTREGTQFMMSQWGVSESEYTKPLISPLFAKDFSNLPPTTLIMGEYDGLRNHSEAYFKKLQQAGNHCHKIVLLGQTHTTMLYRVMTHEGDDPAEVIAQVIKIHS